MSRILGKLIEEKEYDDVPKFVILKEGRVVDTSNDTWIIPCATSARSRNTLKFERIKNPDLCWLLKKFIIANLQTVSASMGVSRFWSLAPFLAQTKLNPSPARGLKKRLIESTKEYLRTKCSSKKRDIITWYIWASERYEELGFCHQYANQLAQKKISNEPKGEAVRTLDPENGPLCRTLEVPKLIDALKTDTSKKLSHIQQRALVALFLALGRNPGNFVHLKETDFVTIKKGEESFYFLDIPRIKKRFDHPRNDLKRQSLEPYIAKHIKELIKANKRLWREHKKAGTILPEHQPLFAREEPIEANKQSPDLEDDRFNLTSPDLYKRVKAFSKRLNIVSPRTEKVLNLTPRRLKYTFGTTMAFLGVTRSELAHLFDHSSDHSVDCYFNIQNGMVPILDRAAAKTVAPYVDAFKGKIIRDRSESENRDLIGKELSFSPTARDKPAEIGMCGQAELCHLDPPFSCYLCPCFEPYADANHELILDKLHKRRNKLLENNEKARLAVQLDHVIFAVTQVVELCKEMNGNRTKK